MPAPDSALRAAFEHATGGEPAADELAFYRSTLPGNGPSLAAMCGVGRLLVPLRAADCNVHGVDPSAAAIAICEERLAAAGRTTPMFRQEPDELNLPFRYSAALIGGGALQRIIDPTRAFAALSRVRAHLVSPASLVVEVVIPPEVEHPPGAALIEVRTATDARGAQIAWRSETRVDIEGRRVDRSNRYERREGRDIVAREDDRSAFTWYDEDEIGALLRSADYRDVEVTAAPWESRDGARRFVAVGRI